MKKSINLVICAIILPWFYLSMHQDGTAIDHAFAGPQLPEELSDTLAGAVGFQGKIEQRISSALKNVGKNLILERTRGAKEISAYQKVAPAVVLVVTKRGFGSGAIIDTAGHVITNWHVVKGRSDVVVVFKPKDDAELKKDLAFSAQVEKIDQVSDLALLKIKAPPKAFSLMRLGDSSALSVGQDVHSIGHPSGEIWTYTRGIISQIRSKYEWTTSEGIKHRAKVIQTQTPISPGSSGGPLFDDSGKLIGINSFRRSGEGLNYAVAVDGIKELLRRRTSRKAQPSKFAGKPRCPESYDTTGKGWPKILGCYIISRTAPPDLWFVYHGPNETATYAVPYSKDKGQINTVIISEGQQWKSLWYYMDTDCDGIVDLIGHQYAGEKEIQRYRRPTQSVPVVTLAKEFDTAIKKRKIPYPELRVCQ